MTQETENRLSSGMPLLLGGATLSSLGANLASRRMAEGLVDTLNTPKSSVLENIRRAGVKNLDIMKRAPTVEDAFPKRVAKFIRKISPETATATEEQLKGSPGFYSPMSKKIHLGSKTSDAVALHELGYAKQHKFFGKTFAPVIVASNLAHRISPLAGIGLASLGSDKDRKKAPLLTGLMAAPNLLLEGGASHSAIRGLKKIYGGSYWRNLKSPAGRSLLKAFGSYAALPVAGVAASLGINAIRDAMERRRSSDGL